MGVTVRDTDKGFRKFKRNLEGPGRSILVGVQGKEAEAPKEAGTGEESPPEMTVGEVASINELGLGVPERSWLRAWVDENERMIQEDLAAAMRQVLLGKLTKEQAVSLLGVKYVAAIQERIVAGIDPPNAPATIARKESSTPLIDTGQLKSAITYVLEQALSGGGGGVTL